jgi:hypothetical protein
MTDSSSAPAPNVFDLGSDELEQFYIETESAAQELRAAGLDCTATHVARASQIGNLVKLAALSRSANVCPTVKRLSSHVRACVVLVQGLEELGVIDPTPEQIAGFCTHLEIMLSAIDKKTPFR